MKDKKIKTYRIIGITIKISIAVVAFWFIYRKVFIVHDFERIIGFYKGIINGNSFIAFTAITFFLMLCNWGFEAAKWRFMIAKVESLTFMKSFEAVLSGVTVSLFTPNRIGEFGARVFFLEKADRVMAAIITILGSMCQLMVTIIFGALGLLYFFHHEYKPEVFAFYAATFLVFVLIGLIILSYFNSRYARSVLRKITFIKEHEKYVEVFAFYNTSDLSKILLLSVFRYFVFSIQYLLLLYISDVSIPLFDGFAMIALSFLAMSVPTISFIDFGIRGAVAVYFIGLLSDNSLGIVMAAFSLWFINLAIPAALGAFFIFKLKLFRNK